MVGSQKPSRITRQKTCCASESNTSVRVVFAIESGFDDPIGVVLAWEERGSCLNIFWMTNRGRISETFRNYEAKDLLRKNLHELRGKRLVAQVSQTHRFALYSRTGVLLLLRLESFWRGRSVEHVFTYSGRQIAVGSQKPSRITRQKTCCASESKSSVRVVFANRSRFDAPIGVALAWEECGSCLNIFRTTNRGRISETFTNYESGFDAPIGVVLAWEERGSCLNIFWMTNRGRISETFTNYEAKDLLRKKLHELRGKRLVAQVNQTRQFANRSGFDAPIGVVLAWEERGSCLNIFRTTNRGRILETFTNYEAKDLLRKSVDHVLTYSGRKITVGSQKPSRITRQKTCCASESNTWVRVVFANRSGFDAPIGVVLAWEERGSCLNIFRTKNRGRISETFPNYEVKDLLRNESITWVRIVFANGSGFDAPIGVVLAWEERGSCLNIFRTKNHSRISETFTNYEAKDFFLVLMLRLESSRRGRSVDHVLTYSGRQIAIGSRKLSRIMRQKSYCASESNSSVSVVFANGSGFDAPIGVVLAWEERASCLNIFRTTNRGRISETITNYEAKHLLRKIHHELRGKRLVAQVSETRRFALYSRTGVVLMLRLESSWHGRSVDHVLTYFGRKIAVGSQKPSRITRSVDHVLTYSRRQIAVGSQKPSRIMRQKTCCASESNTSVRVIFGNESAFDSPIGVVLAWEERG
ncbi:uncharacterized protein G2W53_009803 [Senna tora]|uniref:Uncharacterized protein n=1 Tax=Senna tora TaxID=362788 RepID=A0A835C8T1_9FABA|nr:uncharacterized protein G2W53_009803 [Senna tora]